MSTGAFVAFVLACGWWVLRNLLVYGEPSGSRDTFRFYMGRFLFLDLSSPSSINYFVDASLQSSLGRFGWMTSPLPPAYYLQATVIGTLLLTLTTLFLVAIITRRSARSTVPRYIWQSVVTGLIAALVTITSYVLFSVQVAFQPQGRYLFLILVPTTLALTTGLYFLPVRPLVRVAAFSVLFIWLGFANHVGLLVAAFVSPT
jgi:fluoride ion exporter CrcB/FEX